MNDHIGAGLVDSLPDGCESSIAQNVYICRRTDFAIIEWDARSSDRHSLASAPVVLESMPAGFKNEVNIWREWAWNGGEPMNERANSYVSLVLLNKKYNVTYAGQKPMNLIHRI